jgi:ketosteroid isomerase-like protein
MSERQENIESWKWRSRMTFLVIGITTVVALMISLPATARADDVADVKATELAFNAAQNDGDTDGMFKYLQPERTIFGPSGGRLYEGWSAGSKERRQTAFDAGRKIDLRIENLQVRVYGDTAVSTFYRMGTMKELDGTTRQVHF